MSQEELISVFKGRVARRDSSEQRRITILRAALDIAAHSGVRAIRHRAVASGADVPLSATTYYFKDIHDLITDAFVLFAQDVRNQYAGSFWTDLFVQIDRIKEQGTGQNTGAQSVQAQVCTLVASQLAQNITTTVVQNRKYLQIEFSFMDAALHDERLREPALLYLNAAMADLQELMRILGASEADVAAKSLFGLMRRLQLEALLTNPDVVDVAMVERQIAQQLSFVYG